MNKINEHKFQDKNIGYIHMINGDLMLIYTPFGDPLVELTKEDRQVIGDVDSLVEENEVLKLKVLELEIEAMSDACDHLEMMERYHD